jgi:hypothetical protein
MKSVEAILVKDEEEDHDAGGHPGGESGNIDNGIDLVLPKIAPGGFKIVAEHSDPVNFDNICKAWVKIGEGRFGPESYIYSRHANLVYVA